MLCFYLNFLRMYLLNKKRTIWTIIDYSMDLSELQKWILTPIIKVFSGPVRSWRNANLCPFHAWRMPGGPRHIPREIHPPQSSHLCLWKRKCGSHGIECPFSLFIACIPQLFQVQFMSLQILWTVPIAAWTHAQVRSVSLFNEMFKSQTFKFSTNHMYLYQNCVQNLISIQFLQELSCSYAL